MLKLYGGARSRASIVQWYLEELQAPYEFIKLDMNAGEHLQPDFLAINPMGKVPAIVDDEVTLWESGAILLYLSQKYDPSYPQTSEGQGVIYQWVLFANSTLGQGLFMEANRDREMPRLLTPLEQLFQTQSFILGEQFSVADVAVGSLLCYIPIMLQLDLSDYPAVVAYIERMGQRPAFQQSIGSRS